MNEFTSQFLVEARELTEQATSDLLALEQNPGQVAHIDSAFRAFHTLKGAAGIMEYAAMEGMLHEAEDVLQAIRSGARGVTPDVIDACLACLGQIIRWFDAIETTDALPPDAATAGARVAQQFRSAAAPDARRDPTGWVADLTTWARGVEEAGTARVAIRYEPPTDAFFKGEDPVAWVTSMPGLLVLRTMPRNPWPKLEDMQPYDCNLIIEALLSATPAEVEQSLDDRKSFVQIAELIAPRAASGRSPTEIAHQLFAAQVDFARTRRDASALAGSIGSASRVVVNILQSTGRTRHEAAVETAALRSIAEGDPAAFIEAVDALLGPQTTGANLPPDASVEPRRETAGSIRVDFARVDAIVDLTGELTVVKNALAHVTRLASEGADSAILAASLRVHTARLDRHVAELQRAVLDLRVLPLARMFGRFPLLVRKTAAKLGKQVAFRSEGDETEADKAVVEALFEPLLHVVRNSLDHGVEPPDVREKTGKPRTASILMRGWREGDHVVVEVSDDGRGVDAAVIKRIAVARGIISAEEAGTLNDDEAVELIFAAGFSTAAEVTELSGRGVGMNAVRTSVTRLGGSVNVSNAPGQGLAVRFTLPFTVMMTRVMTVESGGQMFGIPFDAVLETVRTPRSQIRPLGGGQVLVLRDLTIPVFDLASSLKLDSKKTIPPDTACLVIVYIGGQRIGVEIDRPGERLDLMLKPVEGVLAGMPAMSGTSLLGDGRILIVLDLGVLLT